MELLKAGLPVISCATASYNGLGFVHEPKSVEQYEKLLLEAGKIEYDQDLLNVFLYFYFMKVLSMPWEISDKVYGNNFYQPFNIDNINDLLPGKSKELDHLCRLVLDKGQISPESW